MLLAASLHQRVAHDRQAAGQGPGFVIDNAEGQGLRQRPAEGLVQVDLGRLARIDVAGKAQPDCVADGERRCAGQHMYQQVIATQHLEVDIALVIEPRYRNSRQLRLAGIDHHRHMGRPALAGVVDNIVHFPGHHQVGAVTGLANDAAGHREHHRLIEIGLDQGIAQHHAAPAQADHIANGAVLVEIDLHLDAVLQVFSGHRIDCDIRRHQALVPGLGTARAVQLDQH
ncbi:hypothetical protein D3C80_1403190 [compost metagenome]